MTRVAVVGGHGQIGRQLCQVLSARGHQAVAIGRRSDVAAELRAEYGVETRFLDIEESTAADFAVVFTGCDAVVFTAGGGPDGNKERKRTVDLNGTLSSIAAAEQLGIPRFVQVSAMGVDAPADPALGGVWGAYVAAKRDSDHAVRSSSLDWTILRPGRLTDTPPTPVHLGVDLPRGEIPRVTVAEVIAEVLDEPAAIGHQWDLVAGGLAPRQGLKAALQGAS